MYVFSENGILVRGLSLKFPTVFPNNLKKSRETFNLQPRSKPSSLVPITLPRTNIFPGAAGRNGRETDGPLLAVDEHRDRSSD